ncbi:MAG: hypothetical protein GC155_00255 [Alphaproteobacteria bacterium]|nr:hypothetical protein [Alphaproteobacteria bacterium]
MIRRIAILAVTALIAGGFAARAQTSAPPLIYYGNAAGQLTMDRDREGGNPLASGLIDVLQKLPVSLSEFSSRLAVSTWMHSGEWQRVQVPKRLPDPGFRLAPGAGQTRVALVLTNSDYGNSGVASLPGARFDAKRLTEALEKAGFETQSLLDASDAAVRDALSEFAARSTHADVSLIYLGGHGVQHARVVYWILRDYPDPRSDAYLASHALTLAQVSAAAKARDLNLILYGGCRDDPFRHD